MSFTSTRCCLFAELLIIHKRKRLSILTIALMVCVVFYFVRALISIAVDSSSFTTSQGDRHVAPKEPILLTRTGASDATIIVATSNDSTFMISSNVEDPGKDMIPIFPPEKISANGFVTPKYIKIIKMNTRICSDSSGLKWIIYVHANPRRPQLRMLIRETWAHADLLRDFEARVIFLVGSPSSQKMQTSIDSEFREYGDIVQGDFKDTYQNLSLKAIIGLYFISTFCSTVPYAIKCDDDAFVNIFKIRDLAENEYRTRQFLMCFKWTDMFIMRNSIGPCYRWCLDDYLLPGKNKYPPYCAGLGYVISTKLILELYRISISTPIFPIDDVFITGIILQQVTNFTWINLLDTYNISTMHGRNVMQDPNKVLFSHVHIESTWREAWRKLLTNNVT